LAIAADQFYRNFLHCNLSRHPSESWDLVEMARDIA